MTGSLSSRTSKLHLAYQLYEPPANCSGLTLQVSPVPMGDAVTVRVEGRVDGKRVVSEPTLAADWVDRATAAEIAKVIGGAFGRRAREATKGRE